MRYGRDHKAEVHEKIVKDASQRVRAEGLNGAAVSAVMRDAGLTHGGFYKHFSSKDELLMEALRDAFRDITDRLVRAAEQSRSEPAWKAIVKAYLSVEYCAHPERGCPLTALAPELARVDESMRPRVLGEMIKYRDRMVPFMPGRRTAEKERAFFIIFSAMVGAVAIARVLPAGATQETVLASTREFLLRSF